MLTLTLLPASPLDPSSPCFSGHPSLDVQPPLALLTPHGDGSPEF